MAGEFSNMPYNDVSLSPNWQNDLVREDYGTQPSGAIHGQTDVEFTKSPNEQSSKWRDDYDSAMKSLQDKEQKQAADKALKDALEKEEQKRKYEQDMLDIYGEDWRYIKQVRQDYLDDRENERRYQEFQREHQELRDDTAYQRAVADLRAAGFNPNVLFMGGSVVNSGSGSATSSPQNQGSKGDQFSDKKSLLELQQSYDREKQESLQNAALWITIIKVAGSLLGGVLKAL